MPWRSRAVEVGPERRQDVVRPRRVRARRQVAAVVVLRRPAARRRRSRWSRRRCWLYDPAVVLERRDVEVDDLLVADRRSGDAERRQRDVAGHRPGASDGTPGRSPASVGGQPRPRRPTSVAAPIACVSRRLRLTEVVRSTVVSVEAPLLVRRRSCTASCCRAGSRRVAALRQRSRRPAAGTKATGRCSVG